MTESNTFEQPYEDDELDIFAEDTTQSEITVSTQRLLECFGQQRRGSVVNRRVKKWLDKYDLTMVPEIENADYYGVVTITRTQSIVDSDELAELSSQTNIAGSTQSGWFLSSLKADADPLDFLTYGDTVSDAIALMRERGRSKVPLFFNKDDHSTLIGTVLIHDLAFDQTSDKDRLVDKATTLVPVVNTNEKVFDWIPSIIQYGFIYGKNGDGQIVQIYTRSDVAAYLTSITELFLRINEIEELIRRALAEVPDETAREAVNSIPNLNQIPSEESGFVLQQADVNPDGSTQAERYVDTLMFSQYMKCMANESIWRDYVSKAHPDSDKLSRDKCIRSLNDARLARNNVMHFNGRVDAAGMIPQLECAAVWLRQLQ